MFLGPLEREEPRRAPQGCGARCGYTLLEMLAIIALLGLLALASVGSFRRDTAGNLQARADAHRLVVDLQQARSRSIASGDNHLLVFEDVGGVSGYTLHRRLEAGTVAVDDFRPFADNVTVTVSPAAPEFQFEGTPLAAATITLAGPHRTWQVTVIQATGLIEVNEL